MMPFRMKNKPEVILPGEYSHLLIEKLNEEDTSASVRLYLGLQKVPIIKEFSIIDDQGKDWFVFSTSLPDISKLVLELIEKGVRTNIQGINAVK
jgi:hypothetical protein